MNEREMLSQWKVTTPVPATFNSGVWRRIEADQPAGFAVALASWLAALFARPSMVAAYGAAALSLGLIAGNLHATSAARHQRAELQSRYIQSVDPYAKP